jgi:predicted TIM-barrel fold metal-dependent hydrolase
MTEHHINIGQWFERYYTAAEVFEAVFAAGIDRLYFSSTTSCINDIKYAAVEAEIAGALRLYGPEKTKPLLWFRPDYVRQGVTVESAMQALPYAGFKIHPRSNPWDLRNPATVELVRQLFSYADEHQLPVLIHTGQDVFERPSKFAAFFGSYPHARFILAHCRPVDETISLFKRFANVYGDTAFVPAEAVAEIGKRGFAERLYFGTDFPITQYQQQQLENRDIPLPDAYRESYANQIHHEGVESYEL